MIKDGRQIATSLAGIRDDHRERYALAARLAAKRSFRTAVDLGCGTGYGAFMLAEAGLAVAAYEIDPEAVAYGETHYRHDRLKRVAGDIRTVEIPLADLGVAFESIEHVVGIEAVLATLPEKLRLFVGSVPNEEIVPFDPAMHHRHVRHFRPAELEATLRAAGFRAIRVGCQLGKRGSAAAPRWDRTDGRTLLFMAEGRA